MHPTGIAMTKDQALIRAPVSSALNSIRCIEMVTYETTFVAKFINISNVSFFTVVHCDVIYRSIRVTVASTTVYVV